MPNNATPILTLLDKSEHHALEQFDTTALAFQLPIVLPGADLDIPLLETADYESLIDVVTAWRDRARMLIPAPHKVATATKRDEELTSEDREGGWISSTHATDGEGKPITTFQKLVPQEDRVYGPLVAELERFIVFLSYGQEQGALLSRIGEEAIRHEEDTPPSLVVVMPPAEGETIVPSSAPASSTTPVGTDEIAQ